MADNATAPSFWRKLLSRKFLVAMLMTLGGVGAALQHGGLDLPSWEHAAVPLLAWMLTEGAIDALIGMADKLGPAGHAMALLIARLANIPLKEDIRDPYPDKPQPK